MFDVQQLLQQSVVAFNSSQFYFFDDSGKIVFAEITINVENGFFYVRFMLAQVAYIFSYALNNCGILATGTHSILFYLVVAQKFLQLSRELYIVLICIKLCTEMEGVLR